MIYLITTGEYDDFQAQSILTGPEDIDLEELRDQFKQEIGLMDMPWAIDNRDFWDIDSNGELAFIFADWLIEKHGFQKVDWDSVWLDLHQRRDKPYSRT
jgi:hypothetical protein